METSKKFDRVFPCFLAAAIILLLTGCGTPVRVEGVKMKSDTEIAVSEVKLEWLKHCDGLAGPMPDNQVGNLLQDYADMSSALAECRARHNSFATYMSEVVKKERATTK